MNDDIVISYARKDREKVESLAEALKGHGWSVWWDKKIRTGKRFSSVIEEALDSAKAVIVVWSKASIVSDWVHDEAEVAKKREILFPIKIEEVEPPLGFRKIQTTDMIGWRKDSFQADFDKLVDDLSGILGPPPSLSTLRPYPQTTSVIKSRSGGSNRSKSTIEGRTQSSSGGQKEQGPKGMILIPKGPFLYGINKKKIIIEYDFCMDKFAVTNAIYRKFMKEKGYTTPQFWSGKGWEWKKKNKITQPAFWTDPPWNKSSYPVVGVSFHEAEAFAKWAGKRLPSEQEWEKAARGTHGYVYPWGNIFDKNQCNSGVGIVQILFGGKTSKVSDYPGGASPYGCRDMAGNVWEWCVDPYSRNQRSVRGGSWSAQFPELVAASTRIGCPLGSRTHEIGFRCVKDIS